MGESRDRIEGAVARALSDVEPRMADAAARVPEQLRPRLRGWLHAAAVPLAVVFGLVLMTVAEDREVRAALAIYTLTTILLFSVSAAFHTRSWSPRAGTAMRRFDHANIFVFIAGTYTPFVVALISPPQRQRLLLVVWVVAAVGVAFRILWVRAPRWLYVATYLSLGWIAVFDLAEFLRAGGVLIVTLIVAGGLFYSLGALVYFVRRPDPLPAWFGFHEVFHSLTLVGYLLQYTALVLAVTRS